MAIAPETTNRKRVLDVSPEDDARLASQESGVQNRAPALNSIKDNMKVLSLSSEDGDFDADRLRKISKKDLKALQEDLSEAGLYVPPGNKYYRDGSPGGLTDHALRLAHDESYAVKFLSETALKEKTPDKSDIMAMQAALNRLGYDAGKLDGRIGPQTAKALETFLQANPEQNASLSPALRDKMRNYADRGTLGTAFDKVAAPPSKDALPTKTVEGKVLLHPDLIEKMGTDPKINQYVQWTFDAANRHGLDGNMLANQFWQESRYDPQSHSPAGARGIAQIMPETGRRLGLNSRKEFYDPQTSIETGAKHMGIKIPLWSRIIPDRL